MKTSIFAIALTVSIYADYAAADCTRELVAGSTASLSSENSYEVVCDNQSPMIMTESEADEHIQEDADRTSYLKRLSNEREDARLQQKMDAKLEEEALRQQMERVKANRPKPPISY